VCLVFSIHVLSKTTFYKTIQLTKSLTYELSLCSIYQTGQMFIYCIVTMYFVYVLE